jgi:hypothetical protein
MTEDIIMIQTACVGNVVQYRNRCFTNSPGQPAVVVAYATCSDEFAAELQQRIDATTRQFSADHGTPAQ